MPKYRIYAGSVNKAELIETEEYSNESEASQAAFEYACEDYETYAGLHGIPDSEEAYAEAVSQLDKNDYEDEDDYNNDLYALTNEIYNETREGWLSYYVEEVEEEE